jgi:hypothetical protein
MAMIKTAICLRFADVRSIPAPEPPVYKDEDKISAEAAQLMMPMPTGKDITSTQYVLPVINRSYSVWII